MSLTKKIIIGFSSFLTLLLLFNFGLNLWLTNRLPKIIKDNNDTPYHIDYNSLSIDLLPANIHITDAKVYPKIKPQKSSAKIGVYTQIKSITITNFSIWHFIFNDIIKAKSITIDQPNIVLYKKEKDSRNIRKEIVEPFEKIIVVSNIYLHKGTLKIIATQDSDIILSCRNINTKLEDIIISDSVLDRPIPFLFDKYAISCDSLFYKANDFYTIKTNKIKITNTELSLKKLEYLPKHSRKAFVKKIAKEKDQFTIKVGSINVNSMQWGFKNDLFFFKAKSVVLDNVDANIYRNKLPEDDLSKKPLYNTLLRKIKFPLQIDTLLILKSKVVYEEEINFEKGPAKLTFDYFGLKATHIQNGFGLKKVADVDIKVNCRFMKDSPLKVHWTFNPLDLTDGFRIKGNIHNFDIKAMSHFTKPYINATFKGVFNSFNFDIIGNDKNAYGTVNLKYNDLDVTFYQKNNPEKESKLKTTVAKLILKNDSDGKSKQAKIELERIPEKSFYNFLWRSIAASFKDILI